ncbi:MAG: EF-hand domain-containing protein [Planctomycetia bacterium]|nr:EF-hand domain-containing protein [Planctomycetia bacterium]
MLKYLLLGIVLISLAGCSEGTAAPVQNTTVRKLQNSGSLAPSVDAITTPIRIPEAKRLSLGTFKSPTPDPKLPIASNTQDRNTVDVSAEQEKRGGNRRNGKSEFRARLERESESQAEGSSKTVASESKPQSKEAVADVAAKKENSNPVVLQAPTFTSASTLSTTNAGTPPNMVAFGSANSTSSRNFKKPNMPGNVPSWFSENDKDSDGQVAMNEWPADRFAEFSKYDRNGDGIVTLEEAMRTVPKAAAVAVAPPTTPSTTTAPANTATPSLGTVPATAPVAVSAPASSVASQPGVRTSFTMSAGGGAPGTPLSDDDAKRRADMVFMFADTNKDNILDAAEIENARSIRSVDWKKYDANKDGKLDKPEAYALYKAEGNNMRGGGMGGGPGGGGPWGGNQDERMKAMFDRLDKNKTGKLNKEQFPGFWQDRFDEFDTNKDGFVNLDEYKVGFQKIMSNAGGQGGRGARGGFGNDGGQGRGRGGFDR